MAEKRVKPSVYIVEDVQQAEGVLAELSNIKVKLGEIELEQQEEIDLAKTKASQKSSALFARKKELEDALAVFGKLNKSTLFEKQKSMDLGFGIIGFRASTEIVQQTGIKAEMTVQKLKDFKFLDGIKLTETVNRSNMTDWSDEKLETVGLKRRHKDDFFIEIKSEKLSKAKIKNT